MTNKPETNEPTVVNAYLYSRVSSGKQTKGAGLTRQDERGLAICKQHGWNLVPDTLSDVGSAYKGDNILKGDLGRFITAAKEKRLKPNPLLILEQWDRFSRQDLDTSFDEARKLLKLGVAIHIGFAGGKTFSEADLQKVESRVSMEISMQQAWEYSHNLSQRVSDTIQRKFQKASEGKKLDFGCWSPCWVDFIGPKKGEGKFKLNHLAPIVLGIVDDYLNGLSMNGIAKKLNADGVPCLGRKGQKGKSWSQGVVVHYLTTPAIKGDLTVKGQTFKNYLPAIIDETKWKLLQDKLSSNTMKKGGPREGSWIANLFPNRIRCSSCNGTITTGFGGFNCKCQRRYYKCSTARMDTKKCKVRMMLDVNKIEEDFFLLFLKQNPIEILGKNSTTHQVELSKINQQIRDLEKEQEDAVELIGKFPVKAIEKKLATIGKAMEIHKKAKEELTKQMMATDDAPTVFANIKKALVKNDWDNWDKAVEQVQQSLKNLEIRKRLVQMLPNLIDHLTIDLVRGEYTITTRDNKTSSVRSVINLPTID